jgi:hypothetical protein
MILSTAASTTIIIIIIIIFVIAFMKVIYNYIPETNRVCKVCSVVAVPYLQFVLYVILSPTLKMFCACTLLLSEVCLQCPTSLLL